MNLAQVIPINPANRQAKQDQRLPGMAFIPAFLDDLKLSLQAFRVFCHLCRRARLKAGLWIAYPSLETIGRICFGGTYPNAKAPRLRILAARAIEELERRGLLKATRDRSGNEYEVCPMSAWVTPEALEQQDTESGDRWVNPNARTRARRSLGDLKTGRSPGDLPLDQCARSPEDLAKPKTAHTQQFEPDQPPEPDIDLTTVEDLKMTLRRSPGDHNGNSINQGSLLIKKRERDLLNSSFKEEGSKTLDLDLDAGANFSAIDEPEITVEYSFEDDQGNPIDEQNLGIEAAINEPETVAAVGFDPESYAWSAYPGRSCTQVPIEFWRYSLGQVEAIKRERDASLSPKPIGDPESYCRGMLQKQGLQRYLAWQKQFSDVVPAFTKPAPGIHWGGTTPVMDVDVARSLVKQFWRDLGLGWEQSDLLVWMRQAEAMFEGFIYNPKSGFTPMPDGVIVKLCSDLQTTLTQRLGGQQHG